MANQGMQAKKPNDIGKIIYLITGILFILYGGFLVYMLMPQVNAGIHSLVPVVLISIGIIGQGFVTLSQAGQPAPKFLLTGIIFVILNIAGLILFSIRWILCWPFIIGVALSLLYIAGGLIKKKTSAEATDPKQIQA